MNKTKIFLAAVLLIMAVTSLTTAKQMDYNIKVSPYFLEAGKKEAPGWGSFTVSEGKYGRAIFIFYKEGKQVTITTGGAAGAPVTRLYREDGPKASANDIYLSVDLYLKATATKGKNIHLSGYVQKLIRSGRQPLFEYDEDRIDLETPNENETTVPVSVLGGKVFYLEISVQAEGELIAEEKPAWQVTFESEYYLHNLKTNQDELAGKGCVLGLVLDEYGKGTCYKQKVYSLPKGDSLLYICAFEITNASLLSPDRIKFDLAVTHIYTVNPIMKGNRPETIKGEKTTVVALEKGIVAAIGERTEIEIPADRNSLLPFSSKESIVLENKVKEIKN